MLEVINASRAQYGAPPVQLDPLASEVADRQALEAATAGFRGHWNLRGEKPYMRYAFAGGVDHVSENASALWSTVNLDPGSVWNNMVAAHRAFMAETSPGDGHKRNVIDPAHTHVGIGLALVGKQFRYYEEFVDRYFERIDAPSEAKAGEPFTLIAAPQAGWFPYAMVVYREALPRLLTVEAVNAHSSYPDFTDETVLSLWPGRLTLDDSGAVHQGLVLTRPGLYYVQLYLDRTKAVQGRSYTTEGKLQSSGVVITVR